MKTNQTQREPNQRHQKTKEPEEGRREEHGKRRMDVTKEMDGARMEEAKGKGTAKQKRITDVRFSIECKTLSTLLSKPHCPPDDAAFARES